MTRLGGLVRLELLLLEHAKRSLEAENPQYVEAFNAARPNGLEAAMEAARPLLGLPPPWYRLLTSLLEVELALDHVTHTLQLTNEHRSTGLEDGRLLEYHMNYWVISCAALLEKVDSLICRVYRALVRPVRPAYDADLRQARTRLVEMRERYSGLRDPLLHGLPEGPSRSLEEERLWEPGILDGTTMDEIIKGKFQSLPAFRDTWYAGFTQLTAMLIAAIETSLRKTADDVSSLRDG